MALLLVAATAVAVAVVAVMLHGPAAPVTVQSASSTSDASPAAATESPAVGTPASSSPDTQLRAVASSDSAAVEGLAGSWVPQLSSKRPGLVVDGQTDDAAAILAEHQALRSAHPDARLLWSGDFANYRGHDFWVTVVAEPMSDTPSANAWCDAQNLDGSHCYAVRLTHTGGPNGNSVMRPNR